MCYIASLTGIRWKNMRKQGARTWQQRIEKVDSHWSTILEDLTVAYLGWRYPADGEDSFPSVNSPKCPVNARTPRASGARPAREGRQDDSAPPSSDGVQTAASDPHEAAEPRSSDTSAGVSDPASGCASEPQRAPSPSRAMLASDVPPSPAAPAMSRASTLPTIPEPPPFVRDSTYDFEIDVVDMYNLARTAVIQRAATDTTVMALATQGYLAATPISPSLAITFNTLEHFRLLRLRKPSFSLEAFAKVICDSYAVCLISV